MVNRENICKIKIFVVNCKNIHKIISNVLKAYIIFFDWSYIGLFIKNKKYNRKYLTL